MFPPLDQSTVTFTGLEAEGEEERFPGGVGATAEERSWSGDSRYEQIQIKHRRSQIVPQGTRMERGKGPWIIQFLPSYFC